MSALAQQQADFMAQVLDDDAPLPSRWSDRHAAGMAVYRGSYRTALVEALRSTFEQTEAWAGEDSFKRAAAHHLIGHPPSSWTIDDAGAGFDVTCADLFKDNPEVAELAWLEWAMHRAYVSTDIESLSHEDFAARSASFGEDDWADLRFTLVPSVQLRSITQNVTSLWRALKDDQAPPENLVLAQPAGLAVWREDLAPVIQPIDMAELACLQQVAGGASYGQCCELLVEQLGEEEAIPFAGAMLGRWLGNGWIANLSA